ncbi:putative membrane protein [Malaciobacter halophilus]|nr:putative membrane protein [Malaciobacter halophilus]
MTQDIPIEQNMVIKNLMMKMIKSFAKVFLLVDLCIIVYALIFQNSYWLLNSQVAFFASVIITVASFISYKKNVQNRLRNYDKSLETKVEDSRDKVDEIDDPFDLYSEDVEPVKEEDLTPQKIKQIIQEEKSKVKRNSLKNTVFSATGFVSIYRLFGYAILIFGFFALNNNNLFLPIPFLIGLGIVPIAVLFTKAIIKSEVSQ